MCSHLAMQRSGSGPKPAVLLAQERNLHHAPSHALGSLLFRASTVVAVRATRAKPASNMVVTRMVSFGEVCWVGVKASTVSKRRRDHAGQHVAGVQVVAGAAR